MRCKLRVNCMHSIVELTIFAFAKKCHLWARNTPVTKKLFTAFDKQHEYGRYFQHIFISYLYVFLKCIMTLVRKLTLVEIMQFNYKFLPQNSIPCFLKIVCIYHCNKTYEDLLLNDTETRHNWVFDKITTLLLTHWGRVLHICVGKLNVIGSDNGLSPERRQAIIWTNAGVLLIGPLVTNFSEILIEILTFSLKKIRLKMSSAKCCSFRLGLNVLITFFVVYILFSVLLSWNPCQLLPRNLPKYDNLTLHFMNIDMSTQLDVTIRKKNNVQYVRCIN